RRRLQRAKPSGAGERVSAINFASAAPSKIRGRAELGLYLRLNTASNPSSTSWRLVRSIVAMLVSSAAAIRLSLQPSPSSDMSAFSRMRAFVSSWAERLPLWINSSSWACSSALNRTTYFLTAISFPTTNHLHRCLAATEIQKLPSFSMTAATSAALANFLIGGWLGPVLRLVALCAALRRGGGHGGQPAAQLLGGEFSDHEIAERGE